MSFLDRGKLQRVLMQLYERFYDEFGEAEMMNRVQILQKVVSCDWPFVSYTEQNNAKSAKIGQNGALGGAGDSPRSFFREIGANNFGMKIWILDSRLGLEEALFSTTLTKSNAFSSSVSIKMIKKPKTENPQTANSGATNPPDAATEALYTSQQKLIDASNQLAMVLSIREPKNSNIIKNGFLVAPIAQLGFSVVETCSGIRTRLIAEAEVEISFELNKKYFSQIFAQIDPKIDRFEYACISYNPKRMQWTTEHCKMLENTPKPPQTPNSQNGQNQQKSTKFRCLCSLQPSYTLALINKYSSLSPTTNKNAHTPLKVEKSSYTLITFSSTLMFKYCLLLLTLNTSFTVLLCYVDFNTERFNYRAEIVEKFEELVGKIWSNGSYKAKHNLFDGMAKETIEKLESEHQRDHRRRNMIIGFIRRIQNKEKIERIKTAYGLVKERDTTLFGEESESLKDEKLRLKRQVIDYDSKRMAQLDSFYSKKNDSEAKEELVGVSSYHLRAINSLILNVLFYSNSFFRLFSDYTFDLSRFYRVSMLFFRVFINFELICFADQYFDLYNLERQFYLFTQVCVCFTGRALCFGITFSVNLISQTPTDMKAEKAIARLLGRARRRARMAGYFKEVVKALMFNGVILASFCHLVSSQLEVPDVNLNGRVRMHLWLVLIDMVAYEAYKGVFQVFMINLIFTNKLTFGSLERLVRCLDNQVMILLIEYLRVKSEKEMKKRMDEEKTKNQRLAQERNEKKTIDRLNKINAEVDQ